MFRCLLLVSAFALRAHAVEDDEAYRGDALIDVSFSGPWKHWSLAADIGGGVFANQYVVRGSIDGRYRPAKWFSTGARIGGGSSLPSLDATRTQALVTVDLLAFVKGGIFVVGMLGGPWFIHEGSGLKLVPRAAFSVGIEAWRVSLTVEAGGMFLPPGLFFGTLEGRLGFRFF